MMRTVGAMGVAFLVAMLPAQGWAQTVLERVEAHLASEGMVVTYGQIDHSDDRGFVIHDVQLGPPPDTDGVEISIDTWSIAAIDTEALEVWGIPAFLMMSAEGAVIHPLAPMGPEAEAVFGGDTIRGDLSIDYALDPETGVLTLDHLTVSLHGVATTTVTLSLGNVTVEHLHDGSTLNVAINRLGIVFQDHGMMGRLVAALAGEFGGDLEATAQSMVADLNRDFMSSPLRGVRQAHDIINAIAAMIADYQAPGRLSIVAEPVAPVPLDALPIMSDPAPWFEAMNPVTDYDGPTRPGDIPKSR